MSHTDEKSRAIAAACWARYGSAGYPRTTLTTTRHLQLIANLKETEMKRGEGKRDCDV